MEQCSICLESLDGGVVALATCGHRFHAACLAGLARATGTSSTRRGALTACPNCRTTSRVAPVTSAVFSVGDRVLALSKKPRFVQIRVEGAQSKANGKWGSSMFPGREFDDLDAYRAAKKQRAARRAAWSAQAY